MPRWSRNTPGRSRRRKPDGSPQVGAGDRSDARDGDALSEELRAVRKAKGLIGEEEREFRRLVPLGLDRRRRKATPVAISGDETVQFFRKSGPFRAGDRVTAAELLPHLGKVKPQHFAVYREEEIKLAVGDIVRITTNGRDVTGKHRVDNGRIDTIRGFTRDGGHGAFQRLGTWQGFCSYQTRFSPDQPLDAKQDRGHRAGGDEPCLARGDVGRAGLRHRVTRARAGHDLHRSASPGVAGGGGAAATAASRPRNCSGPSRRRGRPRLRRVRTGRGR